MAMEPDLPHIRFLCPEHFKVELVLLTGHVTCHPADMRFRYKAIISILSLWNHCPSILRKILKGERSSFKTKFDL